MRYVAPSATAAFLGPLPVGALHSLRRTHANALADYGMTTIGRLAAVPEGTVQRIIGGRAGREAHQRARGIDPRPVTPGRMPESTSVHHVFGRDVIDPELVRAVLVRVTAVLGMRLRSRGQAARALTVVLQFADASRLPKTRRLPAPSAHTEDLRDLAYRIVDSHALQRARVRRLTVVAEELVAEQHAPTQISLNPTREAQLLAESVVDKVAARWPGSIGPATAFLRVS